MRKLIRHRWGIEIIFSQESWITASFLEIGSKKETKYEHAKYNIIFYIQNGLARFTINGSDYEFGAGKTISIKSRTKFRIKAIGITRLIKIEQYALKDKDFSQI